MAKSETYIEDIRAQVRVSLGGSVPDYLNLTIRNYAAALEMRDMYREKITRLGVALYEKGSTGQQGWKQNPLCGLLYQQEMLCLSYAKALGLTAAKAAAKPEDPTSRQATNIMDEYIDGIKG